MKPRAEPRSETSGLKERKVMKILMFSFCEWRRRFLIYFTELSLLSLFNVFPPLSFLVSEEGTLRLFQWASDVDEGNWNRIVCDLIDKFEKKNLNLHRQFVYDERASWWKIWAYFETLKFHFMLPSFCCCWKEEEENFLIGSYF